MSNSSSSELEEQLPFLAAQADEALAAGQPAASISSMIAPLELQPRIDSALECINLLRQYWGTDGAGNGNHPSGEHATVDNQKLPWQRLGRFELRRELGRGGFGIVYLAYDPELNREVALKVPRLDFIADPRLRARFKKEAKAAAGLDHPNIVAVYETGEVGPVCYIAAAYCPGVTLATWLHDRSRPVAAREAASLIATLADAVEHAHERGLLHRDIKPANVLLQEANSQQSGPAEVYSANKETPAAEISFAGMVPKITDFGLAKHIATGDGFTPQTAEGAIVGTPQYMAPEQAESDNGNVTPATDVYALGAMLYEMLTARPPFQADSVLELLVQVKTVDPVPPRRLRPRLARDLETICLKCLAKQPRQRYHSAAALADDLRRFLAGDSIRARPPGRVERIGTWSRRNPALSALLATVAVATLVVVSTVVWTERNRHRLERQQQERIARTLRELDESLREADSAFAKAQNSDRDLKLWADALAAVKHAESIASMDEVPTERRERIRTLSEETRRLERNHRLLATLTHIQASMGDELQALSTDQDFAGADKAYQRAFLEFDRTWVDSLLPDEAAAILGSLDGPLRIEVAAALDNWAYVRFVLKRQNAKYAYDPNQLHAVSRLLDPDPLRNRIRDAIVNKNRADLFAVAESMDPAQQPAQTVNLLAVQLYWYSSSRDFAEEIAFLQKAQPSHTQDFQINYNLAYALNRAERTDEAIPYAMAATSIRPNSAAAWQVLADALRRIGRTSDAISAHLRTAKLAPRTIWHLHKAGNLLERQEQMDRAKVVYREAAARVVKYSPLYHSLFAAWKKLGLIDEVIAEYRQVLATDASNRGARQGLCTVFYDDKRWADFLSESEHLESANGGTALFHYYLGVGLRNLGKDEEASEAFSRCLNIDPRQGRAKQALDDIHRLAALETKLASHQDDQRPSVQECLDLAAAWQRRKQRHREAAELYIQAFARDPRFAADATKDYHYDAACAAVLTGMGHDRGTQPLSDEDRLHWREQAVRWLSDDLTSREAWLEEHPVEAKRVESDLEFWHKDPDLAGIRDENQLRTLAAGEQESVRQLWANVASLETRVKQSYARSKQSGFLNRSAREKTHRITLSMNSTYRLEMDALDIRCRVRLLNSEDEVLAEGAATGNDTKSVLIFTPKNNGIHQIVATTQGQSGADAYTITIDEFRRSPE